MKFLWSTLSLTLFTACSQLPSTFGDQAALSLPARYDSTPYPEAEVRTTLLSLFDDAQLRAVTRRALQNNPSLASSAARLAEVGFDLEQAKAPLFPFLNGDSSFGRSQSSSVTTSTMSLGLDATWEVDVWGRIRNEVLSARMDRDAAAADLANARQSIAAQTMQAWFDTVAANHLIDLAERQAKSLAATQKLVSRRFEAGTSSLADLELTRSDYQNALADVEARIDERDQAVRVLKTFMGDYPSADFATTTTWPALSRTVPAGIPSDILRQRPDIDAAYHRIRAADARIHVAHAELFPSFILSASAGRSASTLIDLTKAGANSWSLFGNLAGPIFDAGEREAELNAAGKRAEQAFHDYRTTVLTALREVEDALSSEGYLYREEQARLAALNAARRSEERSKRDYEAGLSDLLIYLEVQRRVYTTEEQAINLHATRLNNRVALALALGKAL